MKKFYRMVTGNIDASQIEVYDQMYTEEINDNSHKGKTFDLTKMPKLFYKPADGVKSDLVRGAVSFPVVSKKLREIIEVSGDENVIFHKVELLGLGNDEIDVDKSYSFMNILNPVDCFDFEKSIYKPMEGFPKIATNIDKIVLDETKIDGRKIFRIIQSPGIIFIAKEIKTEIEDSNLIGILITDDYKLSKTR
jgi:hypothetical protein